MHSFHQLIARNFIPAYIFWELTRRCNLRCLHCYLKHEGRKEACLNKARSIIKRLKRMKSLVINFSGGEALLHKDFFAIASYAVQNNFAIKLFSNGTLIDTQTAKGLKTLKPISVDISIYSNMPEIHDAITGAKGSWEKSIRAIQLLRAEGISVRVKCSIMKENIATFKETVIFFKKLKVPCQFNTVLMPAYNHKKNILRHNLNISEHILVARHLSAYFRNRKSNLDRKKSPLCSAGSGSFSINAYGDIMPCVSLPVVLGNIARDDIEDIWAHHKFLTEFRKLRNSNIQQCDKCEYLNFCARCPGISFLKTGSIMSVYQEACSIAATRKTVCA